MQAKFVAMLKRLARVREVVGVDLDQSLLEFNTRRIEPLFIDHLEPRSDTPLRMVLMNGSVAEFEPRLEGCDAVTAIEL